MGKFKLGQEVKARFITVLSMDARGNGHVDSGLPVRNGVISFIHPEYRFICVKTMTPQGYLTEAFKPWEVMT